MGKTYEQENREYLELFSTKELYKAFKDYFADTDNYWFTDLADYIKDNKPEVLKEYLIETLSDDRMFTIAELERIMSNTM